MTEIELDSPWGTVYALGPGATWERSMAHNLVMWQIPGEGVDGMDLWLDSDEIRVTWPWVQTTGALTVNPHTVAAEFASYFVKQRSEASDKNMFTLTTPMSTEFGWIRNISFSGESGKGSMVNCNLSFVVNHKWAG